MKSWLKTDPRGPLVLTLSAIILALLLLSALCSITGFDPWIVGQFIGIVSLVPIVIANGHTLRRRHRSIQWLWLYLIGLGLVPLIIALFARPGLPAPSN